jgi:DNA-binding NarL/FixJ family response regulator
MAGPLRVGLVESDCLTRALIADVLGKEPWITVVWQAGDSNEAWLRFKSVAPQVMLMGIDLPDGNGLTLGLRMCHCHPEMRFLFMSNRDAAELVTAMSNPDLPAWGFIRKSKIRNGATLVKAIKASAVGRVVFEPGEPPRTPHVQEVLSPAELGVLRLASQGLTTDAIAATLKISVGTVETHLVRIYRKLDCQRSGLSPRVAAVVEYLHETQVRAPGLSGR